MMKKIAFVVQRYGLEVNGGAELQCRQMAEHMKDRYRTEVITTKAIDYVTWQNEYPRDEEIINGVLVKRFAVKEPRNSQKFNQLSQKILQGRSSIQEEEFWMQMQGPYSEALICFLRNHKEDYDVFIFCTYLYYTTYFGLQEVYDKAVLIPDAHDELPIHLNMFQKMFRLPKCIFYNTREEKKFVERKFHIESIPNNNGFGGVGVEVPAHISAESFRQKYHADHFILYIGRIEEHKGCKELFQYFCEYKKRNRGSLKLLLMGKEVMKVPPVKDIVSLGFVSDEDKFNGLAACDFLILPSQFESLSMVVLEAFQVGKPVLVNGKCEVLKGHCVRSNGGLYYTDYYEFEGCVNYLLEQEENGHTMGENGRLYVKHNYQWNVITERLAALIETI